MVDRRSAVFEIDIAVGPRVAIVVGVAAADEGVQVRLPHAHRAVVVAVDAPTPADDRETEGRHGPGVRIGWVDIVGVSPGLAVVRATREEHAHVRVAFVVRHRPDREEIATGGVVDEHVVLVLGVSRRTLRQIEY